MRKDILNYEGLYQADSAGFIIKISRPQKDKRYGEFTKEVASSDALKDYYITQTAIWWYLEKMELKIKCQYIELSMKLLKELLKRIT